MDMMGLVQSGPRDRTAFLTLFLEVMDFENRREASGRLAMVKEKFISMPI